MIDRRLLLAPVLVLSTLIPLTRSLLPEKYFYDSEKIWEIASGLAFYPEDRAFTVTGRIYQALTLHVDPVLTAIVSMAAAFFVLYLATRGQPRLTHIQFTIATVYLALASVYLATYSKDVFVLAVVAVTLVVPTTRRAEVVIAVAMLLYAYLFRDYWYLVTVLYLLARAILWQGITVRRICVVVVTATLMSAVAIYLVEGAPLDYYRSMANLARDASIDAASALTTPVGSANPLLAPFGTLLVFLMLLMPVPLLFTGVPMHAVFFVIIASIWIPVVSAVRQASWLAGVTGSDLRNRCLCLLVSYLVVQSIFEPDYGSYIRHVAPLIVLVVVVLNPAAGEASRVSLSRETRRTLLH